MRKVKEDHREEIRTSEGAIRMGEHLFWDSLEKELRQRTAEFEGVAGLHLRDIEGGRVIDINGNEVFPTASSIKIHLLAALAEMDARGDIDLDERVTVGPHMAVPGSGVIGYLEQSAEISWIDVATLMIIVSDNTATNMVIDRVGLDRMRDFTSRWGLSSTVVGRKMQDYEAIAADRENLSTPKEMVEMLALISDGQTLDPDAAEICLGILQKPKKGPMAAALPKGTKVANKPGGMDKVRCDAGIIYLERRPYILAVMTKYYGGDAMDQDFWVADTIRRVHTAMLNLDGASAHGQGIARPPSATG